MATELDSMIIRLLGDGSSYANMLGQAVSGTTSATNAIGQQTKQIETYNSTLGSMGNSVFRYAAGLTALTGITGVFGTIGVGVKLAADAEQVETAFGTMLHSTDKAKQMVAEMQKFAAETPLATAEIQDAGKMLLQYGTNSEAVMPVLKMLGDVTGGNSQKFQSMAYAFSQSASAGRLMGGDLMQMVNAGFNPLQEIAKRTGKSMGQVREMMSAGKISTKMLVQALQDATAAGGQFDGLMQKQSQTLGGLFSTMKDDINMTLMSLGQDIIKAFNIKEIIQMVSSAAQSIKGWLESISPETRRLALQIAGVSAAVLGLVAAWGPLVAVVGPMLATVGGLIMAAFSPMGLLIGAVIGVTAALVQKLGGVSVVLDMIKTGAMTLWTFISPVIMQIGDLFTMVFTSAWEVASYVFDTIAGLVMDVFGGIGGNAMETFEFLRECVMDALYFAEYAFKNMDKVAALVWVNLQLGVVRFGNEIEYLFMTVFPAVLDWFQNNWRNIFYTAVDYALTILINLGQNIRTIFSNIMKAIKGELSFSDIMQGVEKDLTKGFVSSLSKMPEIPPRVMGELESQLSEESKNLTNAMGEDFAAFKADKIGADADKLIPPELSDKFEKKGIDLGNMFGDGMTKPMKEHAKQATDAVLSGSAEANRRIYDFTKTLYGTRGAAAGGGLIPSGGSSSGKGITAETVGPMTSSGGKPSKIEQLLTEIRDTLRGKKTGATTITTINAGVAST